MFVADPDDLGNGSLGSNYPVPYSPLDFYSQISFMVCFLLYGIALCLALAHFYKRSAMERRRHQAIDADFVDHPERLIVSPASRGRLLFISQNLAFALILRIIWLLVKFFDLAPKPSATEESCHNYSTLLSGCNRLSQLLFFTSYTTVVTFWAELLKQVELAKTRGQGISDSNEEELSFVLSRSTLRRDPGCRVVQIHSINDDSVASNRRIQGILSVFAISPHTLQILANFWAYATIVVLLSVQWFVCKKKVYNVIYQGETVTIAFFFLALGVTYFWYGRRLDAALSKEKFSLQPSVIARLRFYIFLLVLVTIISFPLRASLFLAKPVFGYQFAGLTEKILYPWFFYPFPELGPLVVLIYLMSPTISAPSEERIAESSTSYLLANIHNVTDINNFGAIDQPSAIQNGNLRSVWL